jgi:hydrophobic/amphiphilic exporter-1 (mainly G- bacteria), HAE1 family
MVTWGVLAAFCVGIFFINQDLPAGFVPPEDQGMIYAVIQTPPGATLERTYAVSRQLQDYALEVEGVASVSSLAGYEILTQGRGSNSGTCLINLKPWHERKQTVRDIIHELEAKAKSIPGAAIEFFDPPAVPGYGAAGGITLQLLDKNTQTDYKRLDEITEKFMAELKKREEVSSLFSFYRTDYPQYELEIDNQAAMQKGVSIGKAMDNLSILIGSSYDIGFIKFGRFFKVFVQADPSFRKLPTDILNLFVKNEEGEMVPYSSFMQLKKTQGIYEINRYNMYTTATARQIQAAYNYERTVLLAYTDVYNQVYNINNLAGSYDLKAQQVEALNRSVDIVINLFKSARADYVEILLTQRDALESKMELIEIKKQQMSAMVRMYQVLGGGWR